MNRYMKMFSITAGVLLVLLGIVLFIFYWHGSSKSIEAAANKFIAPSSWKLDKNEVHPPSIICWNGYRCPSVYRDWKIPANSSAADIQGFIKSPHVKMQLESSCNNVTYRNSTILICSYYGSDDTFSYIVSPIDYSNGSLGVQLIVELKHQ